MPEHTPAPTPSRAVYGFGMYLFFKVLFVLYVIWVLVPEEWFFRIGITYMPKRYWALAIPIVFLTFLAMFAFIIYPSLGLIMTPSVDDIRTVSSGSPKKHYDTKIKKDQSFGGKCCAKTAKCRRHQYESKLSTNFYNNQISPLCDLDITDVSRKLYL